MKPGDVLAGRFTLRKELGRGATGVVWEAWDEPGDRPVACKVLHPALTDAPAVLRKVEAEAAAAGTSTHPNAVRVYGLWAHEGSRVLVSERVSGGALSERTEPMHLVDALLVAEQVASALEAAHREGRVHGDVRPGNVLLGPTGAKLFDFGLPSWSTSPNVRAGETAPEVVDGGSPRVSSDLYGIGVVLVRAATGDLPWSGPTPYAILAAQRELAGPFEDLPRGVRAVVRALLHPDPDRRPADAASVARALRQLRLHPARPVSPGGRWFAPIRPFRAWIVHGVDPATGGPCVIREGLAKRSAHALRDRLTQEGWSVSVSKEALDVVDLAWAGFAGLFATFAVPMVGWVLVVPLVLRWRSAAVRDRLREALPEVQAPLPPRQLPPGNEVAVAAGLLLFALVGSLALFPPAAIPIGLALVWLAVVSWRAPADPVVTRARTGRIETALAEAVAAIEDHEVDLDANLGLYGEWVELERAWRGGALPADDVVMRAEDLSRRARALRGAPASRLVETVDDEDRQAP